MNNLQQQIQQEQERLSRAREAQAERERAQRQAQADAQTVAESSKRLRQLKIQEAEQQFNHELATSNTAMISEHKALIGELYAALDAYDLTKALELYLRLQASFGRQQQHKQWIVALMRDEGALAAEEERARQMATVGQMEIAFESERSRYINETAIAQAGAFAFSRRMAQVPNAIRPDAALAQHVGTKQRGSDERRIAAGLCFALSGVQFTPAENYSAQADTDTHIRNQYQRHTF